MKLKRDISSNSAPSPDQIEVGELVVNANTGILYSKRVDGTVIKWMSSDLCDTVSGSGGLPVPRITFSDISSFCCGGSALTVIINNLVVDNRYRLLITDLQNNDTVTISEFNTELLPTNSSQRSVVLNITIGSNKPTAIFKFSVNQIVLINSIETNIIKSEKILALTCQQC
jgi:hypothetical protein